MWRGLSVGIVSWLHNATALRLVNARPTVALPKREEALRSRGRSREVSCIWSPSRSWRTRRLSPASRVFLSLSFFATRGINVRVTRRMPRAAATSFPWRASRAPSPRRFSLHDRADGNLIRRRLRGRSSIRRPQNTRWVAWPSIRDNTIKASRCAMGSSSVPSFCASLTLSAMLDTRESTARGIPFPILTELHAPFASNVRANY